MSCISPSYTRLVRDHSHLHQSTGHIPICNYPTIIQYLDTFFCQEVDSGVYREVAELEDKGRLHFHTQKQFMKSLNTLVRTENHVLVEVGITIRNLVAIDFTRKGRKEP